MCRTITAIPKQRTKQHSASLRTAVLRGLYESEHREGNGREMKQLKWRSSGDTYGGKSAELIPLGDSHVEDLLACTISDCGAELHV